MSISLTVCTCEPEHFCDVCLRDREAQLSTFAELAANKISYAGPRDKTIQIKIAIRTAQMMVEAENSTATTIATLTEQRDLLKGVVLGLASYIDRPAEQRPTRILTEDVKTARSARELVRRLDLAGNSRA